MNINKDKLLLSSAPFMFLVLLILSFGLMLPWLGYGFDEWHFIYYSTRGSEGLAELFHYDGHPQATWSFIQSFNALGYTPFYWHLYSLIWRWLAIVSFWLCLTRIWHNHHRQNFAVAALFAVHPVFTLQIFPISFFEVWVGYTLLFLSFFFIILAIQKPEKQLVFSSAAILLTIGHVFTREYAWFVEMMRPVIIWLVLPSKDAWQKRILQTIKIWASFFIIFASSLIWRGFFYTPLRKYFQVQDEIFTNPINTLLIWVLDLIPDISIVLMTSWYETFKAEYVYLMRPFNIVMLMLALLTVFIERFYISKVDKKSESSTSWTKEAVLLSIPSILFGILPFYIASYTIHLTDPPHNSRLAIGMLPGAALLSIALIEKIISNQNLRVWIIAILLGLAVSWHVRYTNDFRKVWEYQSNFLQQLTWRIPGIEKDTAIFVLQPSTPSLDTALAEIALNTDFSMSMAINSIYQTTPYPTENKLSYWYYSQPAEMANVLKSTALFSEHATTYFDGNSSDNLFIYYDPQSNRCLHLVSLEDQFYKQYPNLVKEVAPHTDISRISQTESQNINLRDDILDSNQDTWCFYYQKAELARQYQQWHEIPLLWQNIVDNNLRTEFGTEYLPFIDGFAHLGDWQKAEELTLKANRISKAMGSILCPIWSDIDASTPNSNEKLVALQKVSEALKCTNP